MCPSRARVFGVPASPYRLRLRPCLGSRVVERVVCGAGLPLGCLTGLVRSAVGGPSQPRPARESRRGFAHRFDLSTLPRFTRLRRAPRLMHGETPFTACKGRVGSRARESEGEAQGAALRRTHAPECQFFSGDSVRYVPLWYFTHPGFEFRLKKNGQHINFRTKFREREKWPA